jgi:acetyl esterase/lipase
VTAFDLERFLSELASRADAAGVPVGEHRYGEHPEQRAELRVPEGAGPHPIAVVVHGGFWRERFSLATTRAISVDLTQRGWATWNVEYRRIGTGGGIPETLDDLAAAVRALDSVAAPLARSRVVAIGHSAGGHLALWLAGTGLVEGAVSLAGVCDLTAAARSGIGDGAALELVGGSPDECPDDYRLADPLLRLPAGVPQVLVHGDADDRVPVELSRRYAEAAQEAGDRCELLELRGVGHFEPIDPRTDAWARAAEAIERL